MWYFSSPEIAFGEDALCRLEELRGRLAFIVTDTNIERLGLLYHVQQRLRRAGIPFEVFDEVEPEPSLNMARRAAAVMAQHEPDWVIGVGGGSCIDAAKTAWLLYERPDVDPAAINPFDHFGLRARARLIAIPTTAGTGSEATWYTVLTDTADNRKLGLGARELLPDIAIVDPLMVVSMPPAMTADTGMDALSHGIEGYTSTWRNDLADGQCLKAIQLVFAYLPRAYADGSDQEARIKMQNAAVLGGLGFGNSMTHLAHALGHSLGAVRHVPHGRAVGIFLPYTIEFVAHGGESRYADIARFLDLPARDEATGAASLVNALWSLMRAVNLPTRLADLGLSPQALAESLPQLVANAENDSSLVLCPRLPDAAELRRLFEYAYDGRPVDF